MARIFTLFALFTSFASASALTRALPSTETSEHTMVAAADTRVDDADFAGQLIEQRALAAAVSDAQRRCDAWIVGAEVATTVDGAHHERSLTASMVERTVGTDAQGLAALGSPFPERSGARVVSTARVRFSCR